MAELWIAAAFPAVIWVFLTSVSLLISQNWRWIVLILALQYMGVFVLTGIHWPLEMAVVKLVAGWMATIVLGIATGEATILQPQSWREAEYSWPSSRLFRLLAAGLVSLAVFSVAPKVVAWMPGVSLAQAAGGLILLGMGLLHLGLTAQPLRAAAGLLTALSGFEILYAAVESSALVAGLLAAVNLGLALVGAYLLLAPNLEEAG
ncbi:MAG: hypothetical protein EHM70_09610 [Chloroflexota bacterium]|nr:MAG: hypothetical protein EHM70_09610 [Chloroflexota bacterium]